jgi:hypothetical protein
MSLFFCLLRKRSRKWNIRMKFWWIRERDWIQNWIDLNLKREWLSARKIHWLFHVLVQWKSSSMQTPNERLKGDFEWKRLENSHLKSLCWVSINIEQVIASFWKFCTCDVETFIHETFIFQSFFFGNSPTFLRSVHFGLTWC